MHTIIKIKIITAFFITLGSYSAFSQEISTNEAVFSNPPDWLTASQVIRVEDNIQRFMEWDMRKVSVIWHTQQEEFQNFHHYDTTVLAVSILEKNEIHLGPRIVKTNFEPVFGHEMVHIILYQKYKEAIPRWLNEGLANYIAKQGKVDYAWIASKSFLPEVRSLVHPFLQTDGGIVAAKVEPRYHYQASTALAEMIDSKCNLRDMMQLAVGKKLETYLSNTCEIININADFKKWVLAKAKLSPQIKPSH